MYRAIALTPILLLIHAHAQAEEREIYSSLDNVSEKYELLFNRHDSDGLSKLYAEDADVDHAGSKPCKGRSDILAVYADQFRKDPSLKIMQTTDVSRKVLTPEIVIESGTVRVDGAKGRTEGRYATVYQKHKGQWLVVYERTWPAQ